MDHIQPVGCKWRSWPLEQVLAARSGVIDSDPIVKVLRTAFTQESPIWLELPANRSLLEKELDLTRRETILLVPKYVR